jgi:hypothetical protein
MFSSTLYNDGDFKLQELLKNFNDNTVAITELATLIEIRQGEQHHKNDELNRIERIRDKEKASLNLLKTEKSTLLEELRQLPTSIQNERNFRSIHFLELSSAEGNLSDNIKAQQTLKRNHAKELEALVMRNYDEHRKFRSSIQAFKQNK